MKEVPGEVAEHAVLRNMAAVLDDPHALMTQLVSALGSDVPADQ